MTWIIQLLSIASLWIFMTEFFPFELVYQQQSAVILDYGTLL